MKVALRILLVDDDEVYYWVLKGMVEEISPRYVLDWCPDAESAKKVIQQNNYAAYLIDYRLGIENGLELIDEAVRNGVPSPFILLTAQDDPSVDEQATRVGAADFLIKGTFSVADLERTIRYSLEHTRNLAQIRQLNNDLEKRIEERTFQLQKSLRNEQRINEQLQAEIRERKAAEEGLRVSQHLFRAIGNNFPNGIIAVLDEEFRYVYLNGKILLDRGIDTQALLGHQLSRFLPKDQHDAVVGNFQRVFQGENVSFEYTGTGNQIYQIYASPLPESGGNIRQILVVSTDITAQKQAEKALQESEKHFKAIFHSTYQFTGLLTPDGTVLEVNQTALDFAGLQPADVLHKKFWQTHGWQHSPETQAQLQASVARAAKGEFIRYQVEVQGKDSKRAIIDFSIKPIRNEAGEVVLLIPEGRDMTEMKKSEERLRKSEERLKLFVTQSPTAMALLNKKMRYLAASQQWLDYYDIGPDNYLGRSHDELLPAVAESWQEVQACCLAGQIVKKEEELMLLPNGNAAWIKWEAGPWYDLEGHIAGVLLFSEDITQRKQAEERTLAALEKERELNVLKTRFVSMASHEFRTPLSTIASSASLIARYNQLEDQPKRQKHVDRIQSAIKNMTNILEEFLSVSKLEEGKVKAQPGRFDLVEFAGEITEELSTLAKEGQCICYQHSGSTELFTDKQLLRNVLINLLSNALKYSDASQRIEFLTSVSGTECKMIVRDFGMGIPLVDQPHLFNQFFRAHNVKNVQGTGLGLVIVKRYVELLGGGISFQSIENEGTTFTILLPATLVSPSAFESLPETTYEAQPGAGAKS